MGDTLVLLFFLKMCIFRITDDAREDEMEDNMQVVGSVLGNLKNMAADMGGEIDRQNKQLDKIDVKVDYIHGMLIIFSCVCFSGLWS